MSRVLGKRRPGLLTVDDEIVAVRNCRGLEAREVRTGVRLRITLAPDVFAGKDFRQVVCLLFGCAVFDQQRTNHQDAHVRGAADSPPLLFLDKNKHFAW